MKHTFLALTLITSTGLMHGMATPKNSTKELLVQIQNLRQQHNYLWLQKIAFTKRAKHNKPSKQEAVDFQKTIIELHDNKNKHNKLIIELLGIRHDEMAHTDIYHEFSSLKRNAEQNDAE